MWLGHPTLGIIRSMPAETEMSTPVVGLNYTGRQAGPRAPHPVFRRPGFSGLDGRLVRISDQMNAVDLERLLGGTPAEWPDREGDGGGRVQRGCRSVVLACGRSTGCRGCGRFAGWRRRQGSCRSHTWTVVREHPNRAAIRRVPNLAGGAAASPAHLPVSASRRSRRLVPASEPKYRPPDLFPRLLVRPVGLAQFCLLPVGGVSNVA